MTWRDDYMLQQQLETYVRQNLKKSEILDFVNRDYGFHFDHGSCKEATLSRMLKHFDICYIDNTVTGAEVSDAVKSELQGAGKDLGYRAMHTKIRQKYGLKIPRKLVYDVMTNLDQEGLAKRRVGAKKKKRTGHFRTQGVNFYFSTDGHDKMMGYQNSTFPIAIYGMLDQASRRIMLLKCWTSNSDPIIIGNWYLEHLESTMVLPANIRLDCGTETGKLVSIHAFLRAVVEDMEDPLDSVTYGPSTSNQIERWWKELHERLEKNIKRHIQELLSETSYDPHNQLHRSLMAYVMVPLMQRELDEFKDITWNNHRIRTQKNTLLPDGIPDHIYQFPEQYQLQDCGFQLTNAMLEEVRRAADLPPTPDYLTPMLRAQCEAVIPRPEEIPINHIKTAYMLLKENVTPDI